MAVLDLPFRLPNGANLPNRLAKASMTEALADARDWATDRHVRLYRRWAQGGAGLLLTGNVMIDARYLERPRNVVIEDDAGLAPLVRWAEASKSSGGHAWMQLSHPGRQTSRFVSSEPVAPSAGPAVNLLGGFAPPRALDAEEIRDIVQRFALGARVAERAGFTGVQVHGAHGYLISQFLSPLTNHRDDEWGGSIENRARLLIDVVRAVRASVSASFCLSVKMNSADFQRGGFEEDDALTVARWLEAEGVDLLEVSGGNYESPALFGSERTREREAYFLDFARRLRGATKMPLMVTGGFRTRAAMEKALEENACDVIGLARPLALEPDLPRRLLGREAERSTAGPIALRSAKTFALSEGSWYWAQLRRMANGLDPDARLSPLMAALRYAMTDFLYAFLRKLRPRPTPALRSRAEVS
jgi:2,4-dienoyl-CoA reductase-like NADH-dependent reductase (Old Yellow Enzyme family)